MILTEEEAKTKWCPFARVEAPHSTAPSTVNRYGVADVQSDCRCIASQCMAFRWTSDAFIELKDGRKALVDQGDWAWVKSVSWWWDGRYVKSDAGYLHHHIIEMNIGPVPVGMLIDHRDGDPLNNRLGNLRVVTPAQNAANSASRGGKSQYRGVFQQANGKWSAQISRLGKRLCLGTYEAEEDAAAAYDVAAKEIHGEHARLNLETLANSGRRGFCGLAGKVEA